jgi:hypothetical protein
MSNEVKEVLPSEVKHLLLTWLFEFGRKTIPQSVAWNYLDNAYLNYDIDATIEHCCDEGYICNIEEEKGYGITGIRYKLLDEGVKYLERNG